VAGGAFQAPVKILLEARSLSVETENFPGEGMLSGQGFSPSDALLPEAFSHRGIMRLGLDHRQPVRPAKSGAKYGFFSID